MGARTSGAEPPPVQQLTHVVALDGPAGSGKTTVSRRLAVVLGWRFVDTGATYRALTLAVLRAGVDVADPQAVIRVAREVDIELSTDPLAPGVRLDGEDVSQQIRGPEVTGQVSAVSAVPEVRELLVRAQRRAIGQGGAVVEGRDIARVVAPYARVKVYLDADPEIRARRRAGEQTAATRSPEEVQRVVAAALAARDALDHETNRLEASDGAIHLDTSLLTVDQVVEALAALVNAADPSPDPSPG